MELTELISFIINFGIFIFIIINYKNVRSIIAFKILLISLIFLNIALIFTILEEYYYPDMLNLLEHIFYTLFSIGVLIWILKVRKGDYLY